MTPKSIAQLRLHHQQIARPDAKTPEEVVARLGAMQAQDYGGALWAIGLRLPDATEAEVEKAIARRAIVRTWPMRGTLHFVAAPDAHWMLALLAPRVIASAAKRHAELGLDAKIIRQCEKVFTRVLQGGKCLQREEMLASLQRAKIMADGPRSYHILWRLAQERVICFGPRQGRQLTFALLDEWVPQPGRLEREAALAELARRYFTGHGPATLRDFTWWSGLLAADAREAVGLVARQLASETIAGVTYWMSPKSPAISRAGEGVFLLPGFDEYLLGYTDRGAVLDPAQAGKIVPGGNGIFLPMVVSRGRVIGTWKRALRKKAFVVTPQPFGQLGKSESKGIEAAAKRYDRFMRG